MSKSTPLGPGSVGSARPETVAATAGHYLDLQSGGIVPPVHTATTFARDDSYALINPAQAYARDASPAFVDAENVLAELEQGHECRLFASGMAAVSVIFYCLAPGSHVVLPDAMYWGVYQWTRDYCARNDIKVSYYAPDNAQSIEPLLAAEVNTALVWVETPSNPLMHVTDIKLAAALAHEHDALLIVDSTSATPVFTRPLALGADIVLHSATKYLNGHSDVLAGALVTAREHPLWELICRERHQAGAIPGTFESWLLLRGMRTLYLRVERASNNALQIARFLAAHKSVSEVHYPGLETHPGHTLALQQMQGGFGALMSFQVHGGAAEALRVAGALRYIVSATSLGGVETLIEHRHSVEPPETGIPDNLLRLSVGVEHVDDLVADLSQALESLT